MNIIKQAKRILEENMKKKDCFSKKFIKRIINKDPVITKKDINIFDLHVKICKTCFNKYIDAAFFDKKLLKEIFEKLEKEEREIKKDECPSEQTMKDFHNGLMNENESDKFRDHIYTCLSCLDYYIEITKKI